jgi:hypothetical protein
MEGARLLPAEFFELNYIDTFADIYNLVGIFSQPARVFLAQNLTNAIILFSMDGITNNFVLPAGGFVLIDAGTNKGTPNTASIPTGFGLYAKPYDDGNPPTSGFITLSYWYAD